MKINLDTSSAKDYLLTKARQTGKSFAAANAMMDWYALWRRETRKQKIRSIFNI